MPAYPLRAPYVCAGCLRALPARASIRRIIPGRAFAASALQPKENKGEDGQDTHKGAYTGGKEEHPRMEQDEGAMTRRLRDMSAEALENGGRGAQSAISEAGFSEDLKRELEERIASASFRSDHRKAFTVAELPSHAGRGTRDIAAADPWTGEETVHDASLRMLNDSHKPLRLGKGSRIPGPSAAPPRSIDTGRKSRAATGTRLANARDRSGLYSSLKDSSLDEKEREKRFQELKDRFSPHARAVVPGTIQGLASLANERIEDAIARGQFKNLPRGQKIERDYNASNPFLDTTEYFMNKMIQKQEIVPPWIEKQQELVSTATKFRARLRSDWKRHAARVIASKGGTLQQQMLRAEAYAKAELIANPSKKVETLSTVDDQGHLSQISLSGQLKVSSDDDTIAEEVVAESTTIDPEKPMQKTIAEESESTSQTMQVEARTAMSPSVPPAPHTFRDLAWETTELAYHTLSINDLNSKTRSYNLQAPDLAKKPYFSLQRELTACYADVAPQLADAIRERAMRPKKVEGFGEVLAGSGGVMDRLTGEKVRVRDERVERRYGFRQFWRDVWGERKTS